MTKENALLSTTSRHQYQVGNAVDKKLEGTNGARVRPISYVLNEDMLKMRQCELVILKEEKKFGIYAMDPDGKVVPRIQVCVCWVLRILENFECVFI